MRSALTLTLFDYKESLYLGKELTGEQLALRGATFEQTRAHDDVVGREEAFLLAAALRRPGWPRPQLRTQCRRAVQGASRITWMPLRRFRLAL
jgi:hypothetical protein